MKQRWRCVHVIQDGRRCNRKRGHKGKHKFYKYGARYEKPEHDSIMGFFKKIGRRFWSLKGKEFGLDDRTYYAVKGHCGHCCIDIQVDITTAIDDYKEEIIKAIKEDYLYRHLDERMEERLFELIRTHDRKV